MKKLRNVSGHKIFTHFDRIIQLSSDRKCFPICLELHPTNKCTHNCFNCTSKDVRGANRKKYIDGEQLKRILKQFKEEGGKAVLWSGGGDPTLYYCERTKTSFEDIIKYANELGIDQGVYTNGDSLTPSLIEQIIKCCTFFRISLDSFTEKTHSRVHNTNSFPKVIHNIKESIECKKKNNSQIDIGVSFVVYDNNITDIRLTHKWLEDIHLDYLYFKPGIFRENSVLANLKQAMAFKYIKSASKRYKGNTDVEIAAQKFNNILGKSRNQKRKICYLGTVFPTVSADGIVYYCCHTVNVEKFIVGDTNKNSLKEIINQFQIDNYTDFNTCPINCRGHIINEEVDLALQYAENKHINFL